MAAEVEIRWPLKRYARARNIAKENEYSCTSKENENWMVFQAENGNLTLSYLKTEQVVMMRNDDVEESFSPTYDREYLRGISKGDSVLITYKYEDTMRKFRIQFDATQERSGLQKCQEFVKKFSVYFPISHVIEHNEETSMSQREELSGSVAAGSILTGIQGDSELPMIYSKLGHQLDSNAIKTFIYSCLFDPTFPMFVNDVESILKDVVHNN